MSNKRPNQNKRNRDPLSESQCHQLNSQNRRIHPSARDCTLGVDTSSNVGTVVCSGVIHPVEAEVFAVDESKLDDGVVEGALPVPLKTATALAAKRLKFLKVSNPAEFEKSRAYSIYYH